MAACESEGLWAVPLGGNAYRIDNTPWFARNVAAEDVFLAEPDADGRLWAGERVRWAGNCTIRVIPLRDGPLAGSQRAVRAASIRAANTLPPERAVSFRTARAAWAGSRCRSVKSRTRSSWDFFSSSGR